MVTINETLHAAAHQSKLNHISQHVLQH